MGAKGKPKEIQAMFIFKPSTSAIPTQGTDHQLSAKNEDETMNIRVYEYVKIT